MLASAFLVTSRFGAKKVKSAAIGALVALMVVVGSLDYEVQRGDTLNEIAAEFGVSVAAIMEANGISDPDIIRVGQVLIIPGQEGEADIVHVVRQGETLNSIANDYKTRASAIADLNAISNINLIRTGQELLIPGGSGGGGQGGGGQGGGGSADMPDYHVVKVGETLGIIAARYGLSVSAIAEINGITNTSLIYVGTRLALKGTSYVGGGAEEAIHTVVAGDTLNRIAAIYGVSADSIIDANSISNPNSIRIGQKLRIPGAAGAGWVCPVTGATYFNDWGFPRSNERSHAGNDLFAPRGTPVHAPVSGHVDILNGAIGGFQFKMYGNDGVIYFGTHLDAFGLSDDVNAGDIIGYVGDSGNAVGSTPHLHFEMHPNGGPAVNPYPTLQKYNC